MVIQSDGNNGYYSSQYELLVASLPGSDLPWLRHKRDTALASFTDSGFPSPREEEWRYTNVSAIERKLFNPAHGIYGEIERGHIDAIILQNAYTLVFVDGIYCDEFSSARGLPDGVLACSIKHALTVDGERVKSLLGARVEPECNGFISFNTAFFSDGAYIYIASDIVVEQPIQLVFVSTQSNCLTSTRNLVITDSGAQAVIVETHLGLDELSYLSASVSELFVGENSTVQWNKLQCESDRGFHFGGVYASQLPYGRFEHNNYSFGGLLVRNEVHVELDYASECKLDGLFSATGQQHVDNHTRLNHMRPKGFSRETYKGILDRRAKGVFQGRIVVAEDAQKTDSAMSNRNLLLSADAEIDTKPQLEIYADDVKCAHGVTVGELDEDAIFFLQARGIDPVTAKNILTFAFANEMVERISIPCLRSLVQAQLLNRFPQTNIRKEWL